MTTKVPTSCWLTAMRSDQEDQSWEQKYLVAIATGCTENMGVSSCQRTRGLVIAQEIFASPQGWPTALPGRRSSETEAAPVSYCCVTNPPNRGDLTKACASSSRAPGPAGTRRVSGPAPPIPGLLGRLHSRAGLLGLASRGGAGGGDAALCHLERHPLAGCPGRALTGAQGSKSRTSQTAFGSPGRNRQVVTAPAFCRLKPGTKPAQVPGVRRQTRLLDVPLQRRGAVSAHGQPRRRLVYATHP